MQTNEDVRRVYDGAARAYERLLPDLGVEAPIDRALIAAFAEYVRSAGGSRILDAGCGPGRLVPTLQGHGLSVVGADISPTMIELARAAHPGTGFDVAPLGDLPYGEGQFAGVLSWYSLIHTSPTDLPVTLQELVRVLRSGGYLLAGFQVGSGVRDLIDAYGAGGNLIAFLFTVDEMVEAFVTAGLTIIATTMRLPARERHPQGFVLARKLLS